jgi:hypothetical protein
MKIFLHINELILDGPPLGESDTNTLQTNLEAELKDLLLKDACSSKFYGGALASFRTEGIDLDTKATSADLGRRLGRALYQGIRR